MPWRSLRPHSRAIIESLYLSSCFRKISSAGRRMAEGSPFISPRSCERPWRPSEGSLNVLPRRSLRPLSGVITESPCLWCNCSPGPVLEDSGRFYNRDISIHRLSLGCHPLMAALQDGPSSSLRLSSGKGSSMGTFRHAYQ